MHNNYKEYIQNAISIFWDTKKKQLANSTDKSNRGAVVGGKQLDGFIETFKKVAISAGVSEPYIYTKNNYIPGYFRSSKD